MSVPPAESPDGIAPMNPQIETLALKTRRHFLRDCQVGLGGMALASLLAAATRRRRRPAPAAVAGTTRCAPRPPHFAAKAKRVIYLHLTGSPPHLDLFDYKPELVKHDGEPCPDEFLKGKRFAFTSGVPKLLGTPRKFAQYGKSGVWMSDALPHLHGGGRRAVRHQVDEHRPVQPRPGRAAALHRLAAARAGRRWARGSTYGLGIGEREPARLRRADLQRRRSPTAARVRLGQRLSAVGLPGRAVPLARATRCSTSPTPPGMDRDHAPHEPRRPARPERDPGRASWATPRRSRGSRSTSWPSACRRPCPR